MKRSLEGKVALVAGATRGAGRGIACMLGEAGGIVYCSGRTVRGTAGTGPYAGRTETIDETAEMVAARGGVGIAVRTDHTVAADVERLANRIAREQGRLDIVVNDLWAGGEVSWKRFWTIPIDDGLRMLDRAVRAHVITDHYAVPLMLKNKSRSLIVEVTEGDGFYYRQNFYYDLARIAELRVAWDLAQELKTHKIAVVALTPGFLRSEMVLDSLKVTEANWRDAIAKRPEFAESETPFFIGRAIVALATDPKVMKRSGRVFTATKLADEYGFTDIDGRVPNVWSYISRKMRGHGYKPCDDVFYSYC